jgi:hypothetical protein
MSDAQEATAAASISDGLVHGSLPVPEPKEYKAFVITPLEVVTEPSPAAGPPLHIATALQIIGTSIVCTLIVNSEPQIRRLMNMSTELSWHLRFR